jgi:hypothetical protein
LKLLQSVLKVVGVAILCPLMVEKRLRRADGTWRIVTEVEIEVLGYFAANSTLVPPDVYSVAGVL